MRLPARLNAVKPPKNKPNQKIIRLIQGVATGVYIITCSTYESFSIRFLRTFMFTVPPTPNAGTMRQILAALLTNQFFLTSAQRSAQETPPAPPVPAGRLYISSPRRWTGVEKSWTKAGAANCATVSPLTRLRISALRRSETTGPRRGGTLKEAKIVRQSRSVKSA